MLTLTDRKKLVEAGRGTQLGPHWPGPKSKIHVIVLQRALLRGERKPVLGLTSSPGLDRFPP